MKISDYLTKNDVLPQLSASSREDVIKEMVGHLEKSGKIDDPEGLVSILLDREVLGSTGIGHGVAIPHGRLKGLDEILLVFGRSPDGVNFDAHDGELVNLFSSSWLLRIRQGFTLKPSPGSHGSSRIPSAAKPCSILMTAAPSIES